MTPPLSPPDPSASGVSPEALTVTSDLFGVSGKLGESGDMQFELTPEALAQAAEVFKDFPMEQVLAPFTPDGVLPKDLSKLELALPPELVEEIQGVVETYGGPELLRTAAALRAQFGQALSRMGATVKGISDQIIPPAALAFLAACEPDPFGKHGSHRPEYYQQSMQPEESGHMSLTWQIIWSVAVLIAGNWARLKPGEGRGQQITSAISSTVALFAVLGIREGEWSTPAVAAAASVAVALAQLMWPMISRERTTT